MSFLSTPIKQAVEQVSTHLDTPFFIYDLDKLTAHLNQLTAQTDVKLWYAVKANPLSRIIQCLDSAGFNFDVASKGELEQVLAQGIDSERVLNTGPAKSPAQISHFIARGVRTFVAESVNQVRWLNEQATKANCQLQVLLRVQLRWPDSEKNPLGGDSLTPFGLGCDEWQALTVSDYPALSFDGLHIFQWGNMLSTDKLAELWRAMIAPLQQLASSININLNILDLGGGLGIPYTQDANRLDWSALIETLAAIKADAGVKELWMELGRYAVGECGHYATPVVERKENYNQQQVILSGGINHLLRPAVTSQDFPAALLRESTAEPAAMTLYGPLCTALDCLGEHQLASDLNEQDWLVFSQCGAYGFTESMPYFLCHELAAEYILEQGNIECIRSAEDASYYLR
ncbi:PLP-dependent decarboxylase [Pseudoalteromonas shioyasakiensis]|uniref:PLP-dependent decarboxylase n=1 Tax=Pseudoalteromonas shioyasakiensis TaxID=1190813 RepID=A0ABT6U2L0_9GAMM|nr:MULTISPECIES: PLP-dependent decarboxylase [Pseudoalteromonas]MCO6356942.1 PLP-dependent decarboxylase [Pseudoalteromonas shioyasakiensis]MDI4670408.1 PLP-dependent decarboxylase [Pseudoalteromonas shioyasakiensis]MDI4671659.1 PLP-dependent decarboxylase [Pseudoalteromonas shioyasakiensis]MDI4687317.1 PLP-dependent decarboxylase [Pseudoalteromonas shioyasakiensis]MDI4705912.1 PLP-dependent decarboxylase [Pseudoalteromonas shioyasakiensis]